MAAPRPRRPAAAGTGPSAVAGLRASTSSTKPYVSRWSLTIVERANATDVRLPSRSNVNSTVTVLRGSPSTRLHTPVESSGGSIGSAHSGR